MLLKGKKKLIDMLRRINVVEKVKKQLIDMLRRIKVETKQLLFDMFRRINVVQIKHMIWELKRTISMRRFF